MSDLNGNVFPDSLYLSPDQQDLLLAALSSNNTAGTSRAQNQSAGSAGAKQGSISSNIGSRHKQSQSSSMSPSDLFDSPVQNAPNSGTLGLSADESPYMDFDPDFDFDVDGAEALIGDIPGSLPEENETREKRKSMDGKTEDEESGKKRRESDDRAAKKPGRKPLTSEPTSKRKAQNRAAQRAFRERKEKHLKDLETKVEDLERASESTNHENGLLKAQVERLQVELREYRKRLSWLSSGNGVSPMVGMMQSANARNVAGAGNSDFMFDFPKFGDLPGSHIFNNGSIAKPQYQVSPKNTANPQIPGVVSRKSTKNSSAGSSPNTNSKASVEPSNSTHRGSNDLGARGIGSYFDGSSSAHTRNALGYSPYAGSSAMPTQNGDNTNKNNYQAQYGASNVSNTDSPSASSDSQPGHVSSKATSPEPSLKSESMGRLHDENSYKTGGSVEGRKNTPGNELAGFDWLAQQNGGQFDPVLFGDYRDSQDAILSQDFGTFFDDAFPLPDLGSPYQYDLSGNPPASQAPPRKDVVKECDLRQEEDNEVVPGEDQTQMMTCTKIWDRLQSMEKFRNGEIDVDNLCTELRTKARCSESGVVVNQKDVDDIMGRAK